MFLGLLVLPHTANLRREIGCDVCAAALMMRHYGDDVYMTLQLCCGLRGRCSCKILEKENFFERYDTSATSHLAHVQATYDTSLRAKFRRRKSCRYKVIGDGNSQI